MWELWVSSLAQEAQLLFSVGTTMRKSCGMNTDGPQGTMGGAYEFAKTASANLRQKDDVWNPTIGGFCAGTMLGLRCKI